MSRLLYLVRFFRVVSPLPPLMGVTFAVTAGATVTAVIANPSRTAHALTPLLLLQLFACSSGFLIPARRGHYDLLLTAGESRLRIAAAHWVMSWLPGVGCWLLVALAEALATGGARTSAFASGTALAWGIVSTVPWATTVTLPRFAGAIGWLLTIAIVSTTAPAVVDGSVFTPGAAGADWVEAAVALIVYPPVMVGLDVTGPPGWLAAPAVLLASSSMVFAFGWIEYHDVPLEAAQ